MGLGGPDSRTERPLRPPDGRVIKVLTMCNAKLGAWGAWGQDFQGPRQPGTPTDTKPAMADATSGGGRGTARSSSCFSHGRSTSLDPKHVDRLRSTTESCCLCQARAPSTGGRRLLEGSSLEYLGLQRASRDLTLTARRPKSSHLTTRPPVVGRIPVRVSRPSRRLSGWLSLQKTSVLGWTRDQSVVAELRSGF